MVTVEPPGGSHYRLIWSPSKVAFVFHPRFQMANVLKFDHESSYIRKFDGSENWKVEVTFYTKEEYNETLTLRIYS
jgi:hypothetical protein